MYQIEHYDDMTDEQIRFAVGEFEKQVRQTRQLVLITDRKKQDSVIATSNLDRDARQVDAICKALNELG